MIGFVVPVKPKAVSRDWEYDNRLLVRTAKSICGQTDQKFKLMIVYSDYPEINFKHSNIILVHYPYGPVSVDEIEDLDYVLKYYPKEYAERMMDKGKKIHYGCKIGMETGCQYLMGIDSDDLISNKLAEFVNKNSGNHPAGWRIKKGYIYEENAKILIKKYGIQNINGGTHIIRKDLITIPDFTTNIFWNYNLFESHSYTYSRINDFHRELLIDYPSFGMIYIVHKNNYSDILRLMKAVTIKNLVKKIIRGKLISNKIREEYNLYKLPPA